MICLEEGPDLMSDSEMGSIPTNIQLEIKIRNVLLRFQIPAQTSPRLTPESALIDDGECILSRLGFQSPEPGSFRQ
jgi:hypothetical protein